ncbi:hypothetical protein I7I51_03694 [Histoplasma capsulatum]|uniref:Uncharacterized protein n=1 Tax=Ajellomyces capsulatus TaxID=5037 RepID=A0A8A1M675_AJECA|nr:hypothetical protein I7I51_03694 [Histoplasma capsulatum]
MTALIGISSSGLKPKKIYLPEGQAARSNPLPGVGKRTSKSQGMKAYLISSKGWKAQAQHSRAGVP